MGDVDPDHLDRFSDLGDDGVEEVGVGVVNHRLRPATVVSRTRLECLHLTRASRGTGEG